MGNQLISDLAIYSKTLEEAKKVINKALDIDKDAFIKSIEICLKELYRKNERDING